jgi:ABC-type amino acid transport substrate-binding protein
MPEWIEFLIGLLRYTIENYPKLATLVAFLVFVLAVAFLSSTVDELARQLRRAADTPIGWAAIIGFVGLGLYAAKLYVDNERQKLQPRPVFVEHNKDYIRDPVILTWTFGVDTATPSDRIVYKIVYADSEDFKYPEDPCEIPPCTTESTTFYPEKKFQETGIRWWKVRAKVGDVWTPWSDPIRTTHYENSYERIKVTGRLMVGVSSDRSQGIFKFLDGEQQAGVDIELVKRIALFLKHKLGLKKIEPQYVSKHWSELFDPLKTGSVDIVIAAVTSLKSRERAHNIKFSEGYFCTGKSLLYPAKAGIKPPNCNASIKCNSYMMSVLDGKAVGYGKDTATEELLKVLEKEPRKFAFSKKSFPEVEEPIEKILASNSAIQFAMTDTAFAEARVLERTAGDLISVRLCPCDYPRGYKRLDEYAIAVDTAETDLLEAINTMIRNLKSNNSSDLNEMIKEAAEKKFPSLTRRAPEQLTKLYSECVN